MNGISTLDINEQLKNIDKQELTHLQESIRGQVFTPSEAGYDHGRTLWNGMLDKKPAFIVRCSGTADVIAAVKFANTHDLLISVRGAGHNIAGRALQDDVMLIDLQDLRSVFVDLSKEEAIVSPGATLGDIDHETQMYGLALPVGINSTTGIAGLTLGGGFGWISRKYGLTIDSLLSAQVVTPKGDVVVCDEQNNSDLFWAIRGGGGNFGIITSFRFKLHPVGPSVMAGPLIFDFDEAKSILMKFNDLSTKLPQELSVWSVMRQAPPFPFLDEKYHGKLVLIMPCIYTGPEQDANQYIDKIRALGTPLADAVGPHQFTDFEAAFDPLLTPGARNYWKSHNFKNINEQAIDLIINYAGQLPSPETEIFLAQLGGAINTIDKDATAYPHREVEFVMNVHTRWQDEKQDQVCIDWARALYKDTLPHATGGVYVNFVSEGDDSVDSAYGENTEKLSAIKKKYDPDNRLRNNLNISPQ